MKKKIMFVFGTRPEAIKMAPIISQMKNYENFFLSRIVVTAQHREMLDQVLNLFKIKPDYDLKIMEENQSLSKIVMKTLKGLEETLVKEPPHLILVQGDTSSTFAASLSAFYHKIPLGHVEAGLRTFDKWRPYPEEINRKLTSVLADLHFAPTRGAVQNLLAEKVSPKAIYLTGNPVIDALLEVASRNFSLSKVGINLNPHQKMILVTAHRRESFGKPMEAICFALKRLAQKYFSAIEIVVPVHKNPQAKETIKKILGRTPNVQLIEPLEYEPFVHSMKASYLILTDSGGIQEEAPSLGKPVLVLREKTERPEAIAAGAVKLIGVKEEVIFRETEKLLCDPIQYAKMAKAINPYGDGQASERIVKALLYYFGFNPKRPPAFKADN